MYAPEHRENVEFAKFKGYGKSLEKFMDALENSENSNNPFLDSIVYRLMRKITREKRLINAKLKKEKAEDVLGKYLYGRMIDIKDDTQLDKAGFFDWYVLVNEVLSKNKLFLKFFDRRDKFRFLIKKSWEKK